MKLTPEQNAALFRYLLRLGDDSLILGQRLSEWCGHGPILEEDIALANISLDCIGQATLLLKLAGEVEGKGRSEDALAYWRDPQDFCCVALVEQPNGDFGFTIVRQFFFSAFAYLQYRELIKSSHETLRGIAQKTVKEVEYHLRHARGWMLRLGDGTEESHRRVQEAVQILWEYTYELFQPDANEEVLVNAGIIPDRKSLRGEWDEMVRNVLTEATLQIPDPHPVHSKKTVRNNLHSEHLGHILSEMQSLTRAHPGASW